MYMTHATLKSKIQQRDLVKCFFYGASFPINFKMALYLTEEFLLFPVFILHKTLNGYAIKEWHVIHVIYFVGLNSLQVKNLKNIKFYPKC